MAYWDAIHFSSTGATTLRVAIHVYTYRLSDVMISNGIDKIESEDYTKTGDEKQTKTISSKGKIV